MRFQKVLASYFAFESARFFYIAIFTQKSTFLGEISARKLFFKTVTPKYSHYRFGISFFYFSTYSRKFAKAQFGFVETIIGQIFAQF